MQLMSKVSHPRINGSVESMKFFRHPVSVAGFLCLCAGLGILEVAEIWLRKTKRTQYQKVIRIIKWCFSVACAIAIIVGEIMYTE